ncbi:TolB family protein [candidate division KSB1 bacterium]
MKVIKILYLNIFLLLWFFSIAFGQGAPGTDIFLGEIKFDGTEIMISKINNITDRDGYDNQPYFTTYGKSLLFTSDREDAQTDIYIYDILKKTTTVIHKTSPEAEYSANPVLGTNGKYYSSIRVEADGTQRLWKFPLGNGQPEIIFKDIKPVGYHAWIDNNTVAMFVLADRANNIPITLQIGDTRTGRSETVEENIGRSIHKVPGEKSVSFVHKEGNENWTVKEYDLGKRSFKNLVKTLPGKEDYFWIDDDTIIMGNGSKLFGFDISGNSKDWIEICDLSSYGVKDISRLAVSPGSDRIAVVSGR